MKRRKTASVPADEVRALRDVARRAVDVTNEVAIEVDEPYWTDKERALMRAIEHLEDVTLGRPEAAARRREVRT